MDRDVLQWSVPVLSAAALVGLTGVVYSFGVFFEPIRRTYGLSSSDVSLVFSLHTFLAYTFSTVVGFLADRYDGGVLLGVGTLCWIVGLFGTAFAGSYLGVLLSFGVVLAFGFGFAYVTIYTTVAGRFARRRGLALGILSAGFGFGGLVGPPSASLALKWIPWERAYLAFAVPTTLLLVATIVLFRRTASQHGPSGAAGNGGQAARPDREPIPVATVLRSERFWLVCGGFTLGFYTFYAVLIHLVPFTTGRSVTPGMASLALGLVGGASIPSRLGCGYLSDRRSPLPIVVGGFVVMAVTTASLYVQDSTLWVVGIAVAFGAASGGVSAMYTPLISELFGVENVGRMLGLTSVSFGIAGIAGPYATSLLFAATGSYLVPFIAAAATAMSAAVLLSATTRFTHPAH